MDIIDNINHLLGENLKRTIKSNAKLKIAASCFSIYAFAALKRELERVESLEFIFTSPTFVPHEVTDKIKKEQREFHIPKAGHERNFFGSEFEIQLKNKLTQRAIAKECADWMRRKATFKSNHSKAPMQQFACVENIDDSAIYMPLHGFTAVDLGYQQGDAVSNIVNKFDEPTHSREVRDLFGDKYFDFPKPVSLLKTLLDQGSKDNTITLDFFSGSATTAHAVMALNAEDGGKRQFIMVQLPEACDDKSEAFKAGYQTIADIGKERIRRAGQKIKQDNTDKPGIDQLDIGFRVLKIDSSNMKDVYYTPDQLKQTHLDQFTDNIKDDRTGEDLLFQVLLDWGVDLTLPITQETIVDKTVLFVDGNALAACFDADINEGFVKELATRHPLRAVFRDAGFVSDSVKINVEQVFKLISPTTEIKVI